MQCIACWQPAGHWHWRATPLVIRLCPPCCRYGDGTLCSSGFYGKALCEHCDNEQQYDMSKCGETSQWWVSTCNSECRILHWDICIRGVMPPLHMACWRINTYFPPRPRPPALPHTHIPHNLPPHHHTTHSTPLHSTPTQPSAGWGRHHFAKATARSLSWLWKVPRMQGMGLPVGQAPSTGRARWGLPATVCHLCTSGHTQRHAWSSHRWLTYVVGPAPPAGAGAALAPALPHEARSDSPRGRLVLTTPL